MSPFLILVIVALFLSGAYLFLRNWKKQQLKKLHDESKASLKKNYEEISALLRPVYHSLELGETPAREDVERLAADPRTRYELYKALKVYQKQALCPVC